MGAVLVPSRLLAWMYRQGTMGSNSAVASTADPFYGGWKKEETKSNESNPWVHWSMASVTIKQNTDLLQNQTG